MAAERMKNITDHLTCPLCCELYKKPKYLPCYHSYCEKCIAKLPLKSSVKSNSKQASEWYVTCPDCDKPSPIPTGGVQQLPRNFFINRLLDKVALKRSIEGKEEPNCGLCVREDSTVEVLCLNCGTFLCSYCYDDHKFSKEYKSHDVVPFGELKSKKVNPTTCIKPKPVLCQNHGEEIRYYCETCNQLSCQYNIMKNHIGHDHNMVKEVAAKHREELNKTMELVEKMDKQLSAAREAVSSMRDKIEAEGNNIGKEIDRCYEELCQKLEQQRDDLKKELHEAYKQKTKLVTLQLENIERTQAQLASIKDLSGAVESDQEALLMTKQVVDDVKRISNTCNKLDTQPVQLTTMEFVPVEEYKKSIPQFGRLFDGACSDTSKTSGIPQWVIEGEGIEFKIITRNRQNQYCRKGGNKITVHAQYDGGDVISANVKDNKDGSYTASVVANQVGEVKLSVLLKEQEINGSPFNVKVRGKYTALDKPSKIINKIGKKATPWDIAFGSDGMWAIADRSNHCVRIFDNQGKMTRTFGYNGTEQGKFSSPSGVAFDGNNHIYVTDSWNDRVQKFTTTGTFLLQFGSHGSGNGQLNNPLGILVNNRQVYVAENSGNRISAFRLDGQFSHHIGSSCLKSPCYIAVNADQLLVADSGHHCISMFTLDGNYVTKFGTRGSGSGQLKNPAGIATYMYGFILVTEENNNRISVFDKHGRFVHSFGSKGSGHGQFLLPRGIAISPTGDVYVCDSNNERIQVF